MTSQTILLLIESIDNALDYVKRPINDWNYVETNFLSAKFLYKIK